MSKETRKKLIPLENWLTLLEDMARYAGLLLAPAEGFCLRAKTRAYFAVLAHFNPFLVFSSKNSRKKKKKIQRNAKFFKKSKKSVIQKNPKKKSPNKSKKLNQSIKKNIQKF